MTDNFYLALAAILLIPVIPAYILYKFLPASRADVSGPYKGLSLKLKGAFAGYFLLVLVGIALQYVIMNNRQERKIEALSSELENKDSSIAQLKLQLAASANPVVDWQVNGLVIPSGKEGTRVFFDDGTTENNPDGSFALTKRCIASQGIAKPPKWICIYNINTGFKVVSLNRDVQHPDIGTFDIAFDDQEHIINIRKPIPINSIEKDSIVAVANFIEKNQELKTKVMTIDPGFLRKADVLRKEQQLEKVKRINFERVQRIRPV